MMLSKFGLSLTTNTFSDKKVAKPIDMSMPDLSEIKYFDKDGFELTPLEAIFYRTNDIPLGSHLHHICSQINWFIQQPTDRGAVLDHSMLLYRAAFEGDAKAQVEEWASVHPVFKKLLHMKTKYGIDFNIDWIDIDGPMELFHFEWDHHDLTAVGMMKLKVESWLMSMDWADAASTLKAKRSEWQHLPGMDQNDWKARFFGFRRSEVTVKVW